VPWPQDVGESSLPVFSFNAPMVYPIGEKVRRRGVRKKMAEVKVLKDEPLEKALKRFQKKCQEAGIIKEIKRRRAYEKPSEKQKRKAAEARRKQRRRK